MRDESTPKLDIDRRVEISLAIQVEQIDTV